MIKVLHINTLGEGGAANSAIRLHKGLLKIGLESFLLTLNKTKTPIPRHYTYFVAKHPFIERPKPAGMDFQVDIFAFKN
jgi:hypothetical protein